MSVWIGIQLSPKVHFQIIKNTFHIKAAPVTATPKSSLPLLKVTIRLGTHSRMSNFTRLTNERPLVNQPRP